MAGEVNIDNSVQRQTEKLHGGTKTVQKKSYSCIVFPSTVFQFVEA